MQGNFERTIGKILIEQSKDKEATRTRLNEAREKDKNEQKNDLIVMLAALACIMLGMLLGASL